MVKIQHQFLWGWGQERKKKALVNWKTTSKNRELGGLDIKDIEKFNKSLLGK